MIKLDNELRQVGGFLRVLRVSSNNKTECHDITEILLTVALVKQHQTNPKLSKMIHEVVKSQKKESFS